MSLNISSVQHDVDLLTAPLIVVLHSVNLRRIQPAILQDFVPCTATAAATLTDRDGAVW